jgi:hypothetical protein
MGGCTGLEAASCASLLRISARQASWLTINIRRNG